MAQVILPRWKSDLSALFFRSEPRVEISLMTPDTDYRISFDVSHFGSQLPVQDILLEFPGKPGKLVDDTTAETGVLEVLTIEDARPSSAHAQLPHHINPAQSTNLLPLTIQEPELERSSISSTDSTFVPHLESNTRPCMVCMEERSLDRFPPGKITEYCHHNSFTCFTCLEYSIASDHRNKMWDNISCPQCYTRLSYHDVKKYADPDTFAHYDSLCNREALSSLPNFRRCLGCDSGQIHEDGESCPAVTCRGCNAVSCFNHKIPWHEGLSCGQYDRLISGSTFSTLKTLLALENHRTTTRTVSTPLLRLPNTFSYKAVNRQSSPASENNSASDLSSVVIDVKRDPIAQIQMQSREQKASIKRIKKICKRCPRPGCNWPILKVDGCDHMTCTKCSFEFCWRCRRAWQYGHKCWKLW